MRMATAKYCYIVSILIAYLVQEAFAPPATKKRGERLYKLTLLPDEVLTGGEFLRNFVNAVSLREHILGALVERKKHLKPLIFEYDIAEYQSYYPALNGDVEVEQVKSIVESFDALDSVLLQPNQFIRGLQEELATAVQGFKPFCSLLDTWIYWFEKVFVGEKASRGEIADSGSRAPPREMPNIKLLTVKDANDSHVQQILMDYNAFNSALISTGVRSRARGERDPRPEEQLLASIKQMRENIEILMKDVQQTEILKKDVQETGRQSRSRRSVSSTPSRSRTSEAPQVEQSRGSALSSKVEQLRSKFLGSNALSNVGSISRRSNSRRPY
eukprot:Lankesteria_metandrocarpae@DN9849_c0_g1_i1.p1